MGSLTIFVFKLLLLSLAAGSIEIVAGQLPDNSPVDSIILPNITEILDPIDVDFLPIGVIPLPVKLKIYCDHNLDHVAGGSWALVRHVAAAGNWHPANDDAKGTAAQYGISTSTIISPSSPHTFSFQYGPWSWSKVMFSTGDYVHWAVLDRSSLSAFSNGAKVNILESDISSSSYQVTWYNRIGFQPVDPHISKRDHFFAGRTATTDDEVHSMLYTENSYNLWTYWKRNHQGANVYVQVPQYCPAVYCDRRLDNVAGGSWALVRHVPGVGNWHPALDDAKGSSWYGLTPTTIISPTSPHTFSFKYGLWPWSSILFSTGDYTHWSIMYRSQLSQYSSGGLSTILTSDFTTFPYQVTWYNRIGFQPVDPHISKRDHFFAGRTASTDDEVHSMLYTEGSYNLWTYWKNHHNGANVYVQNPCLCPKKKVIFTINDLAVTDISVFPRTNLTANTPSDAKKCTEP